MRMLWFSEPNALLPLPAELSAGDRVVERAPPLAALEEVIAKKPRKKSDGAATTAPLLPYDRSSDFGQSNSRCQAIIQGKKCAVPYRLDAVDVSMRDESQELMLVEIRDNEGAPGWLDNRELVSVLHGSQEEYSLYSLSSLRRLVQLRVSFATTTRSRNLAKALYRLCEPLPGSKMQVTIIAVSDLESLALVVGELPPVTKTQ
jgi:hypothetical protein